MTQKETKTVKTINGDIEVDVFEGSRDEVKKFKKMYTGANFCSYGDAIEATYSKKNGAFNVPTKQARFYFADLTQLEQNLLAL